MWCFMGGSWKGEGSPSGWAYRVSKSCGAARWFRTTPCGPKGLISWSNLILAAKRDYKELLFEENLTRHSMRVKDIETQGTPCSRNGIGSPYLSSGWITISDLSNLFFSLCTMDSITRKRLRLLVTCLSKASIAPTMAEIPKP